MQANPGVFCSKKMTFLAHFQEICGVFVHFQLTGNFSLRSLGLC